LTHARRVSGGGATTTRSQETVSKLSYAAVMSQQSSRAEQRDDGLIRARQLRTACVVGAAVGTGLLAYLAAGSVPGRAASSAALSTSAGATTSTQPGLQPPQQPPGSGDGGGGQNFAPVVVSGGS
jgi:hypothetical protein